MLHLFANVLSLSLKQTLIYGKYTLHILLTGLFIISIKTIESLLNVSLISQTSDTLKSFQKHILYKLPFVPHNPKPLVYFFLSILYRVLHHVFYIVVICTYAITHDGFLCILITSIFVFCTQIIHSNNFVRFLKHDIYLYLLLPILPICVPIIIIILFVHKYVTNYKDRTTSFHSLTNTINILNTVVLDTFITPHEHNCIEALLNMNLMHINEIMIPKDELILWNVTMPTKIAIQKGKTIKTSYIPIYEDHVDNIIGMLQYSDLLHIMYFATKKSNPPKILKELQSHLEPAYFIPETQKIYSLFKELKYNNLKTALVVNEYGMLEGLVTIEDIISSVIEQIHYNTEETLPVLYPPGEKTQGGWNVSGNISLHALYLYLNILIPKSQKYARLGGFILQHTGTIPKEGTTLSIAGYTFKILKTSKTSIDLVHIKSN